MKLFSEHVLPVTRVKISTDKRENKKNNENEKNKVLVEFIASLSKSLLILDRNVALDSTKK